MMDDAVEMTEVTVTGAGAGGPGAGGSADSGLGGGSGEIAAEIDVGGPDKAVSEICLSLNARQKFIAILQCFVMEHRDAPTGPISALRVKAEEYIKLGIHGVIEKNRADWYCLLQSTKGCAPKYKKMMDAIIGLPFYDGGIQQFGDSPYLFLLSDGIHDDLILKLPDTVSLREPSLTTCRDATLCLANEQFYEAMVSSLSSDDSLTGEEAEAALSFLKSAHDAHSSLPRRLHNALAGRSTSDGSEKSGKAARYTIATAYLCCYLILASADHKTALGLAKFQLVSACLIAARKREDLLSSAGLTRLAQENRALCDKVGWLTRGRLATCIREAQEQQGKTICLPPAMAL